MTVCFWTFLDLTFGTVCHVFHLKMFALALAVQDVFQVKMSVLQFALFLISFHC